MKKKFTILSVLMLIFTTNVNAYEPLQDDSNLNLQSNFTSFTGTVQEIFDQVLLDDTIMTLQVENEEYGIANFTILNDTLILGAEIEVGDVITGFYSAHMPIPAIWPPNYRIAVVNNLQTDQNLKVDGFRFNEEFDALISLDGMLRINIGEDTLIQDVYGNDVDWYLNGRNLAVVYSISTRSIPAMATPELIVVLPVHGVVMPMLPGLPGDRPILGLLPEIPLFPYYWDINIVPYIDWDITINGQPLESETFQIINDDIFIPLRSVVEFLGFTITWNGDTQEIVIDNSVILNIDSSIVTLVYNDNEVVELGTNVILINNITYVPLQFFRLAFGMNNAYFEGGHININTFEVME